MSARLIILTLLLLASGALLWFLPPTPVAGETSPLPPLPADLVALLVLNQPSQNAHLLTNLGDASLDPLALPIVSSMWPAPLRELANPAARRIILAIDRLERREGLALKIHFAAAIEHSPGDKRDVMKSLEPLVGSLVGAGHEVVKDGAVSLYMGKEGRHLWVIQWPGYVIVSNSEEAWRGLLQSWSSPGRLLNDKDSFVAITSRLPPWEGLFIYCDGPRIFPLLPEFGYQTRGGAQVTHEYFPVS